MLKINAGQVLPPRPDGLFKFCVDVSFKNTSFHPASGQMISAPPDEPDEGQHTVPKSLQDECSRVVRGIYGQELEGAKFDSFRICWYAWISSLGLGLTLYTGTVLLRIKILSSLRILFARIFTSLLPGRFMDGSSYQLLDNMWFSC